MFWINCVAAQILRDQYGFGVLGISTYDSVSSQFIYEVDLVNRLIKTYSQTMGECRMQVSHVEVLEMCLLPSKEAVVAYLNSIRPSDAELVTGA